MKKGKVNNKKNKKNKINNFEFPKYEIGEIIRIIDYKYRTTEDGKQIPRKKLTEEAIRGKIIRLLNTVGVITDVFLAEEIYQNDVDANLSRNHGYKILSNIDMKEYILFQDEIEYWEQDTNNQERKKII